MSRLMTAAELATGRWPYILASLGVDERFLSNKHGPCPMCGGRDRWRFDDKEGRGTWFCNNCGAGDGYKLLQLLNRWDFRKARDEVERVMGSGASPADVQQPKDELPAKIAAIRRVWSETEPVTDGDPVSRYLLARIGLQDPPAALRYHPALQYRHDDGSVTYHPAMVAAVTYPDGKAATLHRTYLTSSGKKASVPSAKKLMPGRPMLTGSIKLGGYSRALGIAEGIETALAASMRFSMPVWSCVSSAGMEAWQWPTDLDEIVVFGDNDAKFAGQASAYKLAHRIAVAGIAVSVRIPERTGEDWADVS